MARSCPLLPLLANLQLTHVHFDILAVCVPVHPHLGAQDAVEHERDGEAEEEHRVADLGRGGEQAGEAASDLGADGDDGELASRARAVVRRDLRQFGEHAEWDGGGLEQLKCRLWCGEEQG